MQIAQATRSDFLDITTIINNCAAKKRNFTAINEEQLSSILARDQRYGIKGLLVAKQDEQVIGVTHVFCDNETSCGYIAYVLASDDAVWAQLLSAAEEHLQNAATVYIGSPETPLYHTLEGRFQPLWGSTELLEIDATDIELVSRLKNHGYTARQTHISMVLDLDGFCTDFDQSKATELLSGDDCWYNAYSWYGRSSAQEFGQRNKQLKVLLTRKSEKVMGHIAWYPMRDSNTAALCDLEVATPHRGKGLGKNLLRHGLTLMASQGFKRVELHTNPAESSVALHLYINHGFIKDATWYVCAKRMRNYR